MTPSRALCLLLLPAALTLWGCPKAYIGSDGTPYPSRREAPRPGETAEPVADRTGTDVPPESPLSGTETGTEIETDEMEPTEPAPPRIGESQLTPRPTTAEPGTQPQPRAGEIRSPVIARLADQARQRMDADDPDGAAATIERALRIDPQNPRLWHLLAQIQMNRGQLAQAEQLARKSNVLARNRPALQAANWRLISEVARRRGDDAGADAAAARAEALEGTE